MFSQPRFLFFFLACFSRQLREALISAAAGPSCFALHLAEHENNEHCTCGSGKKTNVYEPDAVVLTTQTLAIFPQGWCMRTGICSLYLLDGSVLLVVVCSLPVVSLQGRPKQFCASLQSF